MKTNKAYEELTKHKQQQPKLNTKNKIQNKERKHTTEDQNNFNTQKQEQGASTKNTRTQNTEKHNEQTQNYEKTFKNKKTKSTEQQQQ